MIQSNINLNAPLRKITSKVELYDGSTLLNTFRNTDKIISVSTQRMGEGKFFGYGVGQKTTILLADKERLIDAEVGNSFLIYFDDIKVSSFLYTTGITRDENTNTLTIVAEDALYRATAITVADLYLASYTIGEFNEACASALGLAGVRYINIPEVSEYLYESGANFNGNEHLRQALNGSADALQAIYYIDRDNYLVFKRLDKDGQASLTIGKDAYFSLATKLTRELTSICSATELGDNISASIGEEGLTHYIKDNPFWDLREDRATLVETALATIGGLSITEFSSKWRGNYLLEIGDKIGFITKDNNTIYSYLVNDSYSYTGGFTQTSMWEYSNEEEKPSNPANLGEALNQTFAKVDKANKRIEMLVENVGDNSDIISELSLATGEIRGSVQSLKTGIDEAIGGVNESITEINKKTDMIITEEGVEIKISQAMANGVDKVETNKGFTFDDEGLTITSDDSDVETTITEDGMTVYRKDEAVLVADNTGVKAEDLHATTYLIIGNNSRFEDYERNGEKRTGCFWIGG